MSKLRYTIFLELEIDLVNIENNKSNVKLILDLFNGYLNLDCNNNVATVELVNSNNYIDDIYITNLSGYRRFELEERLISKIEECMKLGDSSLVVILNRKMA